LKKLLGKATTREGDDHTTTLLNSFVNRLDQKSSLPMLKIAATVKRKIKDDTEAKYLTVKVPSYVAAKINMC